MRTNWTHLDTVYKSCTKFTETVLWTFMQVGFTAIPLLVLFFVYGISGVASPLEAIGGTDALFVALIALIDSSRDSLRAVSLKSEKGETDNIDAMAISSIILVVIAAVVLALAVVTEKGAIPSFPGKRLAMHEFTRSFLLTALCLSMIYKFKLKRLEQKLAKTSNTHSVPPTLKEETAREPMTKQSQS